ncbi:MAG: selenium-dependent molybdenum cofactor biosynthesis protein YqeB [Candidatus Thermoplasmatota archaeon]
MAMHGFYERLAELVRAHPVVAIATVVETSGSAPRERGAKMVILPDGSTWGTIGGGVLEMQVREDALQALSSGRDGFFKSYALVEKEMGGLGSLCGGTASVHVEVVRARDRLLLFGAGHIGTALSQIAQFMEMEVYVVDEREDYAKKDRLPEVKEIIRASPSAPELRALVTPWTYIVILTHSHAQDKAALGNMIPTDAAYIGMIGSRRKVVKILNELASEGVGRKALERVHTPIGLDIGAETPAEIALSILSEIVCVRRKGVPSPMSMKLCAKDGGSNMGSQVEQHRGPKHRPRVLVRGAGDFATGIIHRLHRAGFRLVATELPRPLAVRRGAAMSEAVYEGEYTVEGITAVRCSPAEIDKVLDLGKVPLLIDPDAHVLDRGFDIVVDARSAKKNLGTRISDAPVVLAIGPGFTAGLDCHAVIETLPGHGLGRMILEGTAAQDTGRPTGSTLEGACACTPEWSDALVLRAPFSGIFEQRVDIGESVAAGDVVGWVVSGERRKPVKAKKKGVVRGLIRNGTVVTKGMKLGDIDPRASAEQCYQISEKARAIAGGVLEACCYFLAQKAR